MHKLLESTTPGMHFSYYVHKPQGRPAYAFACEGTVGSGGSSFQTIWPGSRTKRVNLRGTNTSKNRRDAVGQLVTELEADGWIVKGQAFSAEG